MTTDPKPPFPIEVILLMIVTLAAICITLIVAGPGILPTISKSTPTVIQPTPSPGREYQPEFIPISTDTPGLMLTPTIVPTNTPAPSFTPTVTPTRPISGPLPDLIVTGISNPKCTPGHIGETTGNYAKFTIIVRNLGRVATRSFGSFDVRVFLILGQQYYGLDEWAAKFNGVVGDSKLQLANLNPNEDVVLTFEIDLKGNTNFGIEAIANSGSHTIPESDTTNNTLMKYFSVYCY